MIRMRTLNWCAVAFLVLGVAATAQDETQDSTVKSVEINELTLGTESYCYLGQGKFFSLRSCRLPWICLQADTCTFRSDDSTLHLVGTLYDCMRRSDFSEMSFQVLVGAFGRDCQEEPDDSAEAAVSDPKGAESSGRYSPGTSPCLDTWQHYDIGNTREFILDIKVTPGSFLFIVPAESMTASGSEVVNSAIFEIGRLVM